MSRAHPGPQPPADVREALERASLHTRQAGIELLAAARALLDAASISWSGQPSAAHASLAALNRRLDELQERLSSGSGALPAPIAAAILAALDAEIDRWETRSATDHDARAVLRSFLAVREILWEFGVRGDNARAEPARNARSAEPSSPATRAEPAKPAAPAHRVKRVDVKG